MSAKKDLRYTIMDKFLLLIVMAGVVSIFFFVIKIFPIFVYTGNCLWAWGLVQCVIVTILYFVLQCLWGFTDRNYVLRIGCLNSDTKFFQVDKIPLMVDRIPLIFTLFFIFLSVGIIIFEKFVGPLSSIYGHTGS
jgi:hypothetical protein